MENDLEFLIRSKRVRYFEGRYLDDFSRKLKTDKIHPGQPIDPGIMKYRLQNEEIGYNTLFKYIGYNYFIRIYIGYNSSVNISLTQEDMLDSVLPKKSGWIQSYPRRHVGFGLTKKTNWILLILPKLDLTKKSGWILLILPKMDLTQEDMLDSVLPKTGSLPRRWFLYKNELR